MWFALAGSFLCIQILLMAKYIDIEEASALTRWILIVPLLVWFGGTFFALAYQQHRWLKRLQLACPHCKRFSFDDVDKLIASGQCVKCGTQIFDFKDAFDPHLLSECRAIPSRQYRQPSPKRLFRTFVIADVAGLLLCIGILSRLKLADLLPQTSWRTIVTMPLLAFVGLPAFVAVIALVAISVGRRFEKHNH